MRLRKVMQRLLHPLAWCLVVGLLVLRHNENYITSDSSSSSSSSGSPSEVNTFKVEGANHASRTLNSSPPRFNLTGPLTQADFTWHILVHPDEKLLMCHVWKSGSSVLNRLYSRLIGDPDADQFATGNYTRSAEGCAWFKEQRKVWPLPGRNDVICNNNHVQGILVLHMYQPLDSNASAVAVSPDWKRVIMVREPIDRFLSGVFDKCLRKRDAADMQGHCPINSYTKLRNKEWFANITNQRDVIMRVLELAEKGRDEFGIVHKIDPHFASQVHYCGNRRGMQWDHVAVYDAENLDSVFSDLLKATDLPQSLFHGWGPYKNETMLQVGQHHKTLKKQTTTSDRMRNILTPELARRIAKLYAADYELFPVLRTKVPDWVMTG